MQVTENILDPQYRKRKPPRDIMHMLKTGCQRRMLPKDLAPCWHRPWNQRQQEDQRAQGTYCGCGRPLFFVRQAPLRQQLASEDSVPETPSYGTEYACRAQMSFPEKS